MKRLISLFAVFGVVTVAACSSGHNGGTIVPNADHLTPAQSDHAVASQHRVVAESSDEDADRDVPPEAKGEVRRQMRGIMKRIPKATGNI